MFYSSIFLDLDQKIKCLVLSLWFCSIKQLDYREICGVFFLLLLQIVSITVLSTEKFFSKPLVRLEKIRCLVSPSFINSNLHPPLQIDYRKKTELDILIAEIKRRLKILHVSLLKI